MGRKKRHTSRTGDGGAELRLQKQRAAAAEREAKEAELAFYDDPSDGDNASEAVDSDGSEYGGAEGALELGADNSDNDDSDDDDDEEGDDDGVNDDDNDDNAEDFAGQKKKILQMDGKWGKSKKNFYSADTAEFELDSDEEAAKDEEDAALELQRKQADMMDDEDFGFGGAADDDDDDEDDDDAQDDDAPVVDDEDLVGAQLADISMLVDEGDSAIERVHKDFSKLSKKDKLQIVNQSAPELLGLMAELEATMTELKTVVSPAILKLKDVRRKTRAYNVGLQYLVTKQNLMLNYVSNISFYLLLRAEGKSVVDHPVLQHLLLVKKQMHKLEPVDATVAAQLQDLLAHDDFPMDDVDDGMDKFFSSTTKQQQKAAKASKTSKAVAVATPSKKQKKKMLADEEAERAEATAFYEAAVREKQAVAATKQAFYSHEQPALASSSDDDSDAEDAKRGATYEIIKNKGLKAHKSKLNRNPRVKKRMQFRKAVIRRKGQVRDVRVGEASKYGGETTGIKANLTRSRKIRN